MNRTDLTADRWADLLHSYANKNEALLTGLGTIARNKVQNSIQIDRAILSDKQIIDITRDKANSDISYSTLEKITNAFDAIIKQRNEELESRKPMLNRFSAKISLWASNHTTLAKILCVVTLGLFAIILIKGNALIQKVDAMKSSLSSFQSLSGELKNKLSAMDPFEELESCLSKDILGIVFSKLLEEDRAVVKNSKSAKNAMEAADQQKFKLIETYKKEVIELLDASKFQKEIEDIQDLKNRLSKNETFNKLEIPLKEKEIIILKEIAVILRLNWGYPPKKYRNLFNINFFVLIAVKSYGPCALEILPDDKVDREIVLIAFDHCSNSSYNTSFVYYIPERFALDQEIVLKAIALRPHSIKEIKRELFTNRDFLLRALKLNGKGLKYCDETMRKDKELALISVKNLGRAFKHVDEDLKKCEEIYSAAAANDFAIALKYASEEQLNNRTFILSLVKQNGLILNYTPIQFKKDPEIALEAVKQNGNALEWVDDSLKLCNREITLAALQNAPSALFYAPDEFLKDKTLILELIQRYPRIYETIHYKNSLHYKKIYEELLNDEEVTLAAVKGEGRMLAFAPALFQNNPKIVLQAVLNDPHSLHFASSYQKANREIIHEVVKKHPYQALTYASENIQQDKTLILETLNTHIIGRFFRNDEDVILALARKEGLLAFQFASDQLKNNKNFVLKIIKLCPIEQNATLHYLSELMLEDRDVILALVQAKGLLLRWVPLQFKADKEIVLAAVKQNDYALEYASNNLKNDPEILASIIE